MAREAPSSGAAAVAREDSAARALTIAREAIEREANQKESELAPFVELLLDREPRVVVEIGTARGGSFWAWCQVAAPDALVVSIDLPGGAFGGGYSEADVEQFRTFARDDQELQFLRADSHDPATLAALEELLDGRPVDLLFIDGDHTYYGARTDFERYGPLVADGGLVALHDIVPHRQVPEAKVDVLWRELKGGYEHVEFVDRHDDRGWGPWGGIGVLVHTASAARGRARPTPAAARAALMEDVRRARAVASERAARLRELDSARAEAQARAEHAEARLAAIAADNDALRQQVEDLAVLSRQIERERDEAGAVVRGLEEERDAERARLVEERARLDAERVRYVEAHAALEAELERERAAFRVAEAGFEEERARAAEEVSRLDAERLHFLRELERLSLERGRIAAELDEERERLTAQLERERAQTEEAIAADRRRAEDRLAAERRAWAVERELTAAELSSLREEVARGRQAQEFLELVFRTRGWRVLEGYRRFVTRLRRPWRAPPAPVEPPPPEAVLEVPLEPELDAPEPASRAPEEIVLPRAAEPVVSIVVPVYQNLELTLRCLASIAGTEPVAAEVIVVDDASAPAVSEALGRVEGLRVLRNERNLGFLGSCNRGAAEASGEFVLFLNNDTEVTPGWLEALLDAARTWPRVGAVGSKLVYPDGTLQEAGGLIWSDASGMNFGRGGDPAAPEYSYRREVDYCSAASLLVRRDLFERLGGFDERFSPGYYEDTDLCFALRREGYRTVYEPASVVVHHEGATHGTDERAGLKDAHSKAYQHRNRHIFSAKWAEELSLQWPPGTAGGYRGGRIGRRPHVLVADTWVPMADRDSGSLRMTWILRLLRSLGCAVTLYPLNCYRNEPYASQLQRLGIEVTYAPHTFQVLAQQRPDLYDVVVLSRPNVATELLDLARASFPRAALVYDSVDLHFVRELRKRALVGGSDDDVARARELELECIRRSDVTAAITEVEAETIREHVDGVRTVVLPNVHDLDPEPPLPHDRRADLLFIGGFQHEPNVDAVLHLVEDVFPLIRNEIDARILVLGSDPPEEIRRLQSPDVVVTGHLPDVDGFFRRARVFVAPLRYGAGMKGKIGHALAFGLPVVTTPVGAEGMDLVDGEHVLVRTGADAFAEAVVTAYRDADVWQQLSDAGRQVVFERWTPAAMRQRLDALLHEVLAGALAAA